MSENFNRLHNRGNLNADQADQADFYGSIRLDPPDPLDPRSKMPLLP